MAVTGAQAGFTRHISASGGLRDPFVRTKGTKVGFGNTGPYYQIVPIEKIVHL